MKTRYKLIISLIIPIAVLAAMIILLVWLNRPKKIIDTDSKQLINSPVQGQQQKNDLDLDLNLDLDLLQKNSDATEEIVKQSKLDFNITNTAALESQRALEASQEADEKLVLEDKQNVPSNPSKTGETKKEPTLPNTASTHVNMSDEFNEKPRKAKEQMDNEQKILEEKQLAKEKEARVEAARAGAARVAKDQAEIDQKGQQRKTTEATKLQNEDATRVKQKKKDCEKRGKQEEEDLAKASNENIPRTDNIKTPKGTYKEVKKFENYVINASLGIAVTKGMFDEILTEQKVDVEDEKYQRYAYEQLQGTYEDQKVAIDFCQGSLLTLYRAQNATFGMEASINSIIYRGDIIESVHNLASEIPHATFGAQAMTANKDYGWICMGDDNIQDFVIKMKPDVEYSIFYNHSAIHHQHFTLMKDIQDQTITINYSYAHDNDNTSQVYYDGNVRKKFKEEITRYNQDNHRDPYQMKETNTWKRNIDTYSDNNNIKCGLLFNYSHYKQYFLYCTHHTLLNALEKDGFYKKFINYTPNHYANNQAMDKDIKTIGDLSKKIMIIHYILQEHAAIKSSFERNMEICTTELVKHLPKKVDDRRMEAIRFLIEEFKKISLVTNDQKERDEIDKDKTKKGQMEDEQIRQISSNKKLKKYIDQLIEVTKIVENFKSVLANAPAKLKKFSSTTDENAEIIVNNLLQYFKNGQTVDDAITHLPKDLIAKKGQETTGKKIQEFVQKFFDDCKRHREDVAKENKKKYRYFYEKFKENSNANTAEEFYNDENSHNFIAGFFPEDENDQDNNKNIDIKNELRVLRDKDVLGKIDSAQEETLNYFIKKFEEGNLTTHLDIDNDEKIKQFKATITGSYLQIINTFLPALQAKLEELYGCPIDLSFDAENGKATVKKMPKSATTEVNVQNNRPEVLIV